MITMLAVTVSQLLVSVFVDHVNTRVLVACCGAVTVMYAIGWRLLTRRVLRRVSPEAASADATR
jgi:hypothetical protein